MPDPLVQLLAYIKAKLLQFIAKHHQPASYAKMSGSTQKWFGRISTAQTTPLDSPEVFSEKSRTDTDAEAGSLNSSPGGRHNIVWVLNDDGVAIARRGIEETAIVEQPRFLFTEWMSEDEEDVMAGIELVEHPNGLVRDTQRLKWIHIQTSDACETVESLTEIPAKDLPFDIPLSEKRLIKTLLEHVGDVRTHQSSTQRHHDPWGVRIWYKDSQLESIHSAISVSVPYLAEDMKISEDDVDSDDDADNDTHVVGIASENLLLTVAPLEFRKLYNERVLRKLKAVEYGDKVIRLLDPHRRTFIFPYRLCGTWFAFHALIRKQCFDDEEFLEENYRFASIRGLEPSALTRGCGVEALPFNWYQFLDESSTLVGDFIMELRELPPVQKATDLGERSVNAPALFELLCNEEGSMVHGVRDPIEATIWEPLEADDSVKDATKETVKEVASTLLENVVRNKERRVRRQNSRTSLMGVIMEDTTAAANSADANQMQLDGTLTQILYLLKDKNRETKKGVVGFVDDQLIRRTGNKFTWTSSYGRLRINPIPRVDLPVPFSTAHEDYCNEGTWIPMEVFTWPCGEAFLSERFATMTRKALHAIEASGGPSSILEAISTYMDDTIIHNKKERKGIEKLVEAGRRPTDRGTADAVLNAFQIHEPRRFEASRIFVDYAKLVYQFFYPWNHESIMSSLYWSAVTRIAEIDISTEQDKYTLQNLTSIFQRFLYEASIISFSVCHKPAHPALRIVAPHYALPEAFPTAFFAIAYLLLASVEYFDTLYHVEPKEAEKARARIDHYEYLLFRNLKLGKRALLATNHYLLSNYTGQHEAPNSESLLMSVLRRITKASEAQTLSGRYQISVHLRRKRQQAAQMKKQTRAADMAEMHKLQSQLDSVTAAKVTLERQLYFLDKLQMNFDWAEKKAVKQMIRNSPTLRMNRRLLHGCQDAVKRQIAEAEKVENQLKQLLERVTRIIDLNRETSETATLIFTTITTIFFPFSAVTGYFGMNTKDIRDMESNVGEFWKAAAMVSGVFVVLVLLIAFHWRRLQRLWELVLFWRGWSRGKARAKKLLHLDGEAGGQKKRKNSRKEE
ncbi:hypothetical protein BJ508DRAFT_328647 [Ascobolus immersus RN42]|uniref:Ubiquitin-like domain-containing protein n=1 Tax=Ascobolus immersus RN42 TaxID=1160509 RepID=A0A3N4I0V9_ASCIM|nr:hypothetical protein BJ508DRAFT_328647 [Ascobolus immersus RN42]